MKMHVRVCFACLVLLAACSYDSVRMHERGRCGAMPQSESARCYGKTRDTQAEYEAKRKQLKDSGRKGEGKPVDPRYQQWIP